MVRPPAAQPAPARPPASGGRDAWMPAHAGDEQAGDPADRGDSGASASADSTTKIVLGISLLVALAVAAAGWFRVSRAR